MLSKVLLESDICIEKIGHRHQFYADCLAAPRHDTGWFATQLRASVWVALAAGQKMFQNHRFSKMKVAWVLPMELWWTMSVSRMAARCIGYWICTLAVVACKELDLVFWPQQAWNQVFNAAVINKPSLVATKSYSGLEWHVSAFVNATGYMADRGSLSCTGTRGTVWVAAPAGSKRMKRCVCVM